MAEITEELEPLFDYRRVQPFKVISIDDDDDDELDSRAKKAKKDSKPAVEKADVSAKVVTVIEEDEEDWLIPAPKVARPALADNSILKMLRLQKQELEAITKSAKNVVRDLEESVRQELFSFVQTSPDSKATKVAPAPKPQVERNKVVICIQGKDDKKQQFRIFVDDKLDRVFKMYADKVKIDIQRLVFKFDGDKIAPNATPQSLDMEDQDIIEVHDTSNKKGAPSIKKTG